MEYGTYKTSHSTGFLTLTPSFVNETEVKDSKIKASMCLGSDTTVGGGCVWPS